MRNLAHWALVYSASCMLLGCGIIGDITGSDDDPESDAGIDGAADAGDGTDSGADHGTDAVADSGTDAGADSGTDAGADSGTDAGADSGTDAGADSGTDAGADDGGVAKARWTYLVYMAADNDLEIYWKHDMDELATAGSGNNVNVVVQVDRAPGYDTSDGNWIDTRRYYVAPGKWTQVGASLGELNMGDPKTLSDFLMWAAQEYPAERYALVLWDHGDSWRSEADTGIPRSVAADETSGWDSIEVSKGELAAALQNFTNAHGPLDAVMFDACLMSSFEVAYALQGYAKFMAGSGTYLYATGIDYKSSINSIKNNASATGRDLTVATADGIVKISKEQNASAIDISKVAAVADALQSLSSAVLANSSLEAPLKTAIGQARGLADGWQMYYIDMKDLASKIAASSNATIKPYGTAIVNAITPAVAVTLGLTCVNGQATNFGGFNFMADYAGDKSYLNMYAGGCWNTIGWDDVLLKLAN